VSTGVPFWPPAPDTYPGKLPDRADVLVIGGGITGVSLMHHLGKAGIDAVLVERSHLAAGASGRNAGFLLAGVADCYAEAVRIFGRPRARDIWNMTEENHIEEIAAVTSHEIGYRRQGSIVLASGAREAEQLAESAELMTEDGFECTWDGARLTNPRDGEVTPSLLVAAFARQAPAGSIREGVGVTAIERANGEVVVHAGDDECHAGCVILATNAYTPQLLSQVPIQPRRAQMLASAPEAARLCDQPTYSHFGYRYWRQLPTGEILIGGWRDTAFEVEVGYDERPTAAVQGHLEAHLRQLGADAEVTHRWAGTMGFTESGLPLIGPVDGLPNVYLCAGYNGHGMGFAFMSAKQLVSSL
jgi:glycine/D-amino acid oxidase-like deaminating enzyme